jgi:hypothetical protein
VSRFSFSFDVSEILSGWHEMLLIFGASLLGWWTNRRVRRESLQARAKLLGP